MPLMKSRSLVNTNRPRRTSAASDGLHLRDPFLALANAARLAREAVVGTDVFHQNEWDGRVVGAEILPLPTPMPKRADGPHPWY